MTKVVIKSLYLNYFDIYILYERKRFRVNFIRSHSAFSVGSGSCTRNRIFAVSTIDLLLFQPTIPRSNHINVKFRSASISTKAFLEEFAEFSLIGNSIKDKEMTIEFLWRKKSAFKIPMVFRLDGCSWLHTNKLLYEEIGNIIANIYSAWEKAE